MLLMLAASYRERLSLGRLETRNIETVQMRIVVEDKHSFFSFTDCWVGESVACSEEEMLVLEREIRNQGEGLEKISNDMRV